jgi:hypothetical protein
MNKEPRVIVSVDLGDGEPPIACTSFHEAVFFQAIWKAYHGDYRALALARTLLPVCIQFAADRRLERTSARLDYGFKDRR